jgi:hypothetical protein
MEDEEMAERMTEIHLPQSDPSVGYADWGELSASDMIKQIRAYGAHLRAQADAIESAADHEFQIATYLGVHVQRNRREIQHSSRLAP